jgi:predicted enzyme related to lactoylglutathione lyase
VAAPLVHLELHTRNLGAACGFYRELLGWEPERLAAATGSYQALDLAACTGGVVECGTDRALWLPYAQVACVASATRRAESFGASVLLEPRDGPTGWRSVIATPAGGELALWQPKR